jgi:hypothetical protein
MYCEKRLFKKKQQVVVLLGAGAAMPWGGITGEDIKHSFIEHFDSEPGDAGIGKSIFNILEKFYTPDCYNFETFLAALEEILSYVISSTNEGGVNASNTSFIPAIFHLKERINEQLANKSEEERRQYCYMVFQKYVNALISKIAHYNSSVSDAKFANVSKNLVRFTKYFLHRDYAVKYYTTNYDSVIPQVLSPDCKIYEGLRSQDKFSEERRFNIDLELFRKARLSHFNLHGSIFLCQKFMSTHYETVYANAPQVMLPNALTENGGNPNEKLLFSPIIAGYKKTQRSVNQPFSLGFNAFANDCNSCRALCVAGYSVSDPHINAILSSYIKWDNTRFVYVTKEGESFSKEIKRLSNELVKIDKEGTNEWIHDGRKHVFKKGFETFLEDKSNWEYLHSK